MAFLRSVFKIPFGSRLGPAEENLPNTFSFHQSSVPFMLKRLTC